MALVVFQNNSAPYLNADNLNNNFNELKPYVLYNDNTGTTGNVTLSDSASNYSLFKILYSNADGFSETIDLLSPNGKTTSLTMSYYNEGTNSFMHWAGKIMISDSVITHSIDYYYENNNGVLGVPQTINYIKINKVVGYK